MVGRIYELEMAKERSHFVLHGANNLITFKVWFKRYKLWYTYVKMVLLFMLYHVKIYEWEADFVVYGPRSACDQGGDWYSMQVVGWTT